MDEVNSKIYGLEFQARALAAQQETDAVRFLIGTQVLKDTNNQVHLIEVAEETDELLTRVYQHSLGEIWKLTCSPHDPQVLCTCYSTFKGANPQWTMQSSLMRLPMSDGEIPDEHENLEVLTTLDTTQYGTEIRTTEFSPSDASKIACVVDSSVLIVDIGKAEGLVSSTLRENENKSLSSGLAKVQLPGKGNKLTSGKWSMHHQGNQFITLCDTTIKSWDIRDSNQSVWTIDGAHSQLIRDLDSNPNKQFHIASCGDDGALKVWDYRNAREPVFVRTDHSHWIWSVRYNTFHDQLILTSSSDSRVLLTCAISVSSEAESEGGEGDGQKERLQDGLLHSWDAHEDSVYCSEWSSVDPWTFASLSYDGRLVVSKVPKQHKYQILL